MTGISGNDPVAMERQAGRARQTAATVLAIRAVLERVRADGPLYGDLAATMVAEFDAQLLPRLRQAEDALGSADRVLVWNAAEQRHVSEGGPAPSGPRPEYRTPGVAPPRRIEPPLLGQRQTYQVERPTPPTFADGVSFAERIRRTQEQLTKLIGDGERRLTEQRDRLPGLRDQLAELMRQHAEQQSRPRRANDRMLGPAIGEVTRELAETEALSAKLDADIGLYKSLQGRQILYFDPKGDGALVELQGKIDGNTKQIGIMIPGMNVDKVSVASTTERAQSFVDASNGELAVVVALLGDHPDNLESVSASYAQELGGPLKELAGAVRTEAGQNGAAGAKLAVEGHSYASAILTEAEKKGMRPDRMFYMTPAGGGHGLGSMQELVKQNPEIERYAIHAPGDPIQSVPFAPDVGNWGLGPDMTNIAGVTQLCSGNYPPGSDGKARPMQGLAAHSDVWVKDSDSWRNALGVLNSGQVRVEENQDLHDRILGIVPPIIAQSSVCGPTIDIDELEKRKKQP